MPTAACGSAGAVGQAAQFDQFEAKGLYTIYRPVWSGLIQVTRQYGPRAVRFNAKITENFAPSLAETTADGDPVMVIAHAAAFK